MNPGRVTVAALAGIAAIVAGQVAFLPGAASGSELTGQAEITDADTLSIGDETMRREGIDAPEREQTCRRPDHRRWPCGQRATQVLTNLIGSAEVRCAWSERDTYRRALGTCFVEDTNLNAELVAEGWALAYRR